MEDDLLDELVNLLDRDSDDDFIDELYQDKQEQEDDNTTTTNDCQDVANDGDDDDQAKGTHVSPENMSKRMTAMEDYIKFLESKLKAKNEEQRKSPDNGKNKENSQSTLNAQSDEKISVETEGVSKAKTVSTPSMSAIKHKSEQSSNKQRPSSSTSQSSSDVKKSRIAHAPKTADVSSIKNDTERRITGQKRKADEPAPYTSSAKKPAQDSASGVTDGYSGLRIVNPLVSSTVMKKRMEGRRFIKISSIQSQIRNNDIKDDWVTIGVVTQKMSKKTAKGEVYSIWKLSDLAFHLQTSTISLFLFGENHKEHWKTMGGSVIALLNPSVLPPREKQYNEIAFTLDNPMKLMMLGMSQDFGVCQSSRKSDGKRCSNFINKSEGNYCQYHVQREYSKKRSNRMECQQGYGAPSKFSGSSLKQKVSGEAFFYGGKIVSTRSTPSYRKEKVTTKSLAGSSSVGKDYLDSFKEKQNEKKTEGESSGSNDGPSKEFLSLLSVPTFGSRNLKLHLHNEDEKEREIKEPKPVLTAAEFLKATNIQIRKEQQSRSRSQSSTVEAISPSLKTPVLGRGLSSDGCIVFDENVPFNLSRTSSNDTDKAKKRALEMVRKNGPIAPTDPNDVRSKKPSPKLRDVLISKLGLEDEKPVSTSAKRPSSDGAFSWDSAEAQRILKAKSRYIGQVRQAEIEQEEAYFKMRETKEDMETKMLSTKEMKVKAVQCLQCKYVAEKAGVKCKEEKHTLKYLQVMKRFFSCHDCSERTVAYGQRYPTRECRKCGGKNWEKCGMWKEKSGPKVGGESLMVRGPEYAKFLNSLQSTKTNGILPKYL